MITLQFTAVAWLQLWLYFGGASSFWQKWQGQHQWTDSPWSWGYDDMSVRWTPPPTVRPSQPPISRPSQPPISRPSQPPISRPSQSPISRPSQPRPMTERPIIKKPTTPPPTTKQTTAMPAPVNNDKLFTGGPILVVLNETDHPRRDWAALINSLSSEPEVQSQKQEEPPVPEEPDPCEPFPRIVPDFRAADRRVSQVKCYEYIWGIKYRVDKTNRGIKCEQKKAKERGEPTVFHFAAIGGRGTRAGEFPHMGAIGWKTVNGSWVFKCGGSLISEKFVLSAAHCTSVSSRDDTVAELKPKIVRLGDKNILKNYRNTPPLDVNIIRSIVHPEYESPTKYHDIALFEFEPPIKEYTMILQPACLWGKLDMSSLGTKATLTGWGVIDVAKQTTTPELQAADVDIIEPQLCNQLMRPGCNRNWCGLRNQVCAGKLEGGVDACQGDSGGPLQVKIKLPYPVLVDSIHYVVGVTSFGMGCARAKSPGVYTQVSSYIDWIESVVWP